MTENDNNWIKEDGSPGDEVWRYLDKLLGNRNVKTEFFLNYKKVPNNLLDKAMPKWLPEEVAPSFLATTYFPLIIREYRNLFLLGTSHRSDIQFVYLDLPSYNFFVELKEHTHAIGMPVGFLSLQNVYSKLLVSTKEFARTFNGVPRRAKSLEQTVLNANRDIQKCTEFFAKILSNPTDPSFEELQNMSNLIQYDEQSFKDFLATTITRLVAAFCFWHEMGHAELAHLYLGRHQDESRCFTEEEIVSSLSKRHYLEFMADGFALSILFEDFYMGLGFSETRFEAFSLLQRFVVINTEKFERHAPKAFLSPNGMSDEQRILWQLSYLFVFSIAAMFFSMNSFRAGKGSKSHPHPIVRIKRIIGSFNIMMNNFMPHAESIWRDASLSALHDAQDAVSSIAGDPMYYQKRNDAFMSSVSTLSELSSYAEDSEEIRTFYQDAHYVVNRRIECFKEVNKFFPLFYELLREYWAMPFASLS